MLFRLAFSIEDGKKYIWAGQAKTGTWRYCIDSIKIDINKSIIRYYFADSMMIMCDIMRGASSSSDDLRKVIKDVNHIVLKHSSDRDEKVNKVIEYFKDNDFTVRIPCLIMATEKAYSEPNPHDGILSSVKKHIEDAFKDFKLINSEGLSVEVLLLVFPVRDIAVMRKLFMGVRKS